MFPAMFGERMLDDFFNEHMMPALGRNAQTGMRNAEYLMKTDVRQTEQTYELDIELPGFKKEEVGIELDKGCLTIRAAKVQQDEAEGTCGRYLRRERFSGACSRSFYVGEALEPEDVSARFEDGILKITFPRVPEKKQPEKKTVANA